MTQIVLDAELRQKFGNLTKPVELTDEQGKVLATVLPSNDPDFHLQLGMSSERGGITASRNIEPTQVFTPADAGTLEEIVMFQVDYLEPVLGRLATVWVNADEPTRRAITAAANIDRLRSAAARSTQRRVSRGPAAGAFCLKNLSAAIYRFEPDGRTVTVVNMWLFKSPRKPAEPGSIPLRATLHAMTLTNSSPPTAGLSAARHAAAAGRAVRPGHRLPLLQRLPRRPGRRSRRCPRHARPIASTTARTTIPPTSGCCSAITSPPSPEPVR